MHLFQVDQNRIINLDMIISLEWGNTLPGPSRELRVTLASPSEFSPVNIYLSGDVADRLWYHALANVVVMIPGTFAAPDPRKDP